eukprot:12704774-Alexandrium_andersonii.AAC.1
MRDEEVEDRIVLNRAEKLRAAPQRVQEPDQVVVVADGHPVTWPVDEDANDGRFKQGGGADAGKVERSLVELPAPVELESCGDDLFGIEAALSRVDVAAE